MTTEVLIQAQAKKSEIEERRETLLPLRQGLEELINLHGETTFEHDFLTKTSLAISSYLKKNFNVNFPVIDISFFDTEDAVKVYQSWGQQPNRLKTELQVEGSAVEINMWRSIWFKGVDSIYIELEASPKRLVLTKRLEESRIEELKTKYDFSYTSIEKGDYTSSFPTEEEVEQFSQLLNLLEQKFSSQPENLLNSK